VWSIGTNIFDLYVMLLFGIMGYVLRKLEYEPAPLVLAFVLGPMLEKNLRQALILSDGNLGVFFTRPLSAACLIVCFLLLLTAVIPAVRKKRSEVVVEED
jgi:putative tricarboxylic transport membrane protein